MCFCTSSKKCDHRTEKAQIMLSSKILQLCIATLAMNLGYHMHFVLGEQEQIGEVYVAHDCEEANAGYANAQKLRSDVNLLIDFGAVKYPYYYAVGTPRFIGTTICFNLPTTSTLKSWDCRACLDYIKKQAMDNLCKHKIGARYASTQCVITYRFFPEEDNDEDSCPALWIPDGITLPDGVIPEQYRPKPKQE